MGVLITHAMFLVPEHQLNYLVKPPQLAAKGHNKATYEGVYM